MFTAEDVKRHKRVVVLGPTVVQNLFSGADPVGQSVRVNGTAFQVVGVTDAKGSNGDAGPGRHRARAADRGPGRADGLRERPELDHGRGQRARDALDAAQAEITSILTERKHVEDPTNPGFQVINQGAVREASDASTDVFTTLLGAVAAISLLVGGIGVMNIMLVSVTERTREIGIRKAIGARRADILAQFLTEAVLVSHARRRHRRRRRDRRQPVPDRRRRARDRPLLGLPGLRRLGADRACSSAPTPPAARRACARSTPCASNKELP